MTATYIAGMSEPADALPSPPDLVFVIDAVDTDLLADFWAAALGYRRADSLEQYEILLPADGRHGPMFLVQGVSEPKVAKNRMHVDLHVDDPDAEAARLVGLGAERRGSGSLGEISWIVMADPEGNEFDIGRR